MSSRGHRTAVMAVTIAVAVAACGPAVSTPSSVPSAGSSAQPSPQPSTEVPATASPSPAGVARWAGAGQLAMGRASTHALALADGRVLVVGNDNICTPGGAWEDSAQAEILDPTTGAATATGSLNAPRTDFAAVLLADGRALVTGGLTSADPAEGVFGAYSSTKLFDPGTGTWTNGGLLNTARTEAAAALLPDGSVLVAGGAYVDAKGIRVLASAEMYDPESDTWTRTGDMLAGRRGAQATTLADGRVLVVGGSSTGRRLYFDDTVVPSAEIYDPGTGTWSAAGGLSSPRRDFSLAALADGGALVAGGTLGDAGTEVTATAERFDPSTRTWSTTGAMLQPATSRSAVLLGDGRVLVAGGVTLRDARATGGRIERPPSADAELYDPVTGSWSPTARLPEPREGGVFVTLPDRSVLLVGGDAGYVGEPSAPWCPQPLAKAVRYVPENLASFPPPAAPATATLARSDVPRAAAKPADAKTAASAINAFGIDLYRRMLADDTLDKSRNGVFSPTSIALALAMARAGAKGPTGAEMDDVLRAAGPSALANAMNALEQALSSRSGRLEVGGGVGKKLEVVLRLANAPFAQRGMAIEQPYLDTLASRYGAGLRLVDYERDPEAARGVINAWVTKQTAGRIPQLLADGDVTELTRLVLVNAMYLKAPWLNPFEVSDTKRAPFTLAGGTRVSVPMMDLIRCQGIGMCTFPYATGSGWRAVELPYLGDALVMTIIVPDNLAAFERGLTASKLTALIRAMKVAGPPAPWDGYDVHVRMPRFGIDTRADLSDTLLAMGMDSAFDVATADFSGISPIARETGLYISKVIHQANIDVDESGTEAAAATAVEMATGGGPNLKPVDFRVDRPFLFVLRDVETGAILFMGRVVDPSQK